MKIIRRFEDEDLRKMVVEKCGVPDNCVHCVYTEDVVGPYEEVTPIFYIEVEENE